MRAREEAALWAAGGRGASGYLARGTGKHCEQVSKRENIPEEPFGGINLRLTDLQVESAAGWTWTIRFAMPGAVVRSLGEQDYR